MNTKPNKDTQTSVPSIKKETLEERIKDKMVLPYPYQDDGEYYPDFDKYGELWQSIRMGAGTARDCIISYNEFHDAIDRIQTETREALIKEIENDAPFICSMEHEHEQEIWDYFTKLKKRHDK